MAVFVSVIMECGLSKDVLKCLKAIQDFQMFGPFGGH